MRELLFKNMTSLQKNRKTLSIQEIKENKGLLTRVNRKYIYIVKAVAGIPEDSGQAPEFYILKEYNSKEQVERFLFKVKGDFHIVKEEKVFLVHFCHSLKITLDNHLAKQHPA